MLNKLIKTKLSTLFIALITVVFSVIGFMNLNDESYLIFNFFLFVFSVVAIFSLSIIEMISGALEAKDLGEKELAQSRVDCAKQYVKICKTGSVSETQWLDIIKNNGY